MSQSTPIPDELPVRRAARAPRVCIVVPTYNEAANILTCIDELRAALPDATILVVDNRSTDGTEALARSTGELVLVEQLEGKGSAVTTGVAWALEQGFDWIALHDADNEYSAQGLAKLVAKSQAYCPDTRVVPAPSVPVMGVGEREVCLGRVLWRSLIANLVARTTLLVATHSSQVPRDILTGTRVFNRMAARRLFALTDEGAPFLSPIPLFKGFELETKLTRRAVTESVDLVSSPVRYTQRATHLKKISGWDMFPIIWAACRG